MTDQGRIHRDDVVDMARAGVQLLDDLHGLPLDERLAAAWDDEVADHIRDDFCGPEPDFSVEDIGQIPAGVLEYGALMAAKRILLDA